MDIDVIAQNAIKITTKEGKKIYCDPFQLKKNELNDADVIFITHSHYDHFSPEDIKKIKNANTKIIVTIDLLEKAILSGFNENDVLEVIPNNEYDFAGIKFKTIPAYNTNKEFHRKEYNWVSYIIEIDDSIIYIAGDTDVTDEALNVKCDIALVPVGGTYTMNADEAAKLIKHIAPTKCAIPTHYQTVVGSLEDALTFKSLLKDKVEVKILLESHALNEEI